MQNILEMCDGEVRATEIYCKLAASPSFVSEWNIERFPGCWNLRVRNKNHPSLWFTIGEIEANDLTTMEWNDSRVVPKWNVYKYENMDDLVKRLTQMANSQTVCQ